MNFFNLQKEIPALAELIYEFSGQKEMWKTRFTNDVLAKIDGGHKIVGLWRNHGEELDGTPCGNCYIYADTACGNGEFCMNCVGNDAGQYTIMSYADYKSYRSSAPIMNAFETYEDFKRWRNAEKIRIDSFGPCFQARDIQKVLLEWEIKKTLKVIN